MLFGKHWTHGIIFHNNEGRTVFEFKHEQRTRGIGKKQKTSAVTIEISKVYDSRPSRENVWFGRVEAQRPCRFAFLPVTPPEPTSTVTLYGYSCHKHPLCHPVKCFFSQSGRF